MLVEETLSPTAYCRANQLTGFYMVGTLVVKGLTGKTCVSKANQITKMIKAKTSHN